MQYILTQNEYDTVMTARARLMEAEELWQATGIDVIMDNKTRQARLNGLTLIHQGSREKLWEFFSKLNMTNEL